ncbi:MULTISPECIES: hypothetical protein [Methylococcus]|uniref:Lipoprotein n=1 Tax=Methylococcus capsulatus TaxID=414 RepID=A0AA35UDB2_METCP|nr:hypothetical protein [Methylococcus capsulatus]QXP91018.1 hypothetical protein KW114_02335 [Methylococcus capsulatus]CAI8873585.1 exported protein of unknown function [Methylococcus capsulatus]
MKRSILSSARNGLAAACALIASAGVAHAQSACYTDSLFPDERFVIDAETQGVLVSSWYDLAALLFGGKQTAYSVHGKYVYAYQEEGDPWVVHMAAATGTIDIGTRYFGKNVNPGAVHTQTGARLGLTVHIVEGTGGEALFLPVTLDCRSTETSVLPSEWSCESYNAWGDYFGVSTLTRVPYQADDERCNLFEVVPPTMPTVSLSQGGHHKSRAFRQ